METAPARLPDGGVGTAAYDEIADWYEERFLAVRRAETCGDPLGIDSVLRLLLGDGGGTCLEIGCGTGVHVRLLRELGWAPVGVDLSGGMLRHARAAARTPQPAHRRRLHL